MAWMMLVVAVMVVGVLTILADVVAVLAWLARATFSLVAAGARRRSDSSGAARMSR